MKVISIVGTRPELIKMSEISKKLDQHTDHIIVNTGQNYDYELNRIFYDDLELRPADYYLNVMDNLLGKTIGNILARTQEVLEKEKPDAVVILGDTNSALASLIVKRLNIPLFHLEAGNRCFDDNVPEEINRRLIDHISDVNMVYTEHGRRNLLDEGLAKNRIFLMGSPMCEVVTNHNMSIQNSTILEKLELTKQKYFLVSIHREENLNYELREIVNTLNTIASKYKLPIIMSTHPHTLNKIVKYKLAPEIIRHKPFGFFDYMKLQINAKCVISDSGTVSEESAMLSFPAITIRRSIERPEALDAGSIIMAGLDKDRILECISIVEKPTTWPSEYNIDNCSERVLKIVMGYTDNINWYTYAK